MPGWVVDTVHKRRVSKDELDHILYLSKKKFGTSNICQCSISAWERKKIQEV